MKRDFKKNINPLKKCNTKKCAKEIKLLKDDKELMEKNCKIKSNGEERWNCKKEHESSDARKKIEENLEKCTRKKCRKEHKKTHIKQRRNI